MTDDPSTVACSALDTLLALSHHQGNCRQCRTDERLCNTALTYRTNFERDLRVYARLVSKVPAK